MCALPTIVTPHAYICPSGKPPHNMTNVVFPTHEVHDGRGDHRGIPSNYTNMHLTACAILLYDQGMLPQVHSPLHPHLPMHHQGRDLDTRHIHSHRCHNQMNLGPHLQVDTTINTMPQGCYTTEGRRRRTYWHGRRDMEGRHNCLHKTVGTPRRHGLHPLGD
jgi:hypothetical protein